MIYRYLQKVIRKKMLKKLVFVCVLKVTDEKSRIRIAILRYRFSDPDLYRNVRSGTPHFKNCENVSSIFAV
jgi:hypothetical protein